MSILDVTSGATYDTLSAAITGSAANDVLQVPAGSYQEDFPNITHNLTINAIGGFATLSNPQPLPPNNRAVLNIPGDSNVSLTISNLEITGANNDSIGLNNAAGILFETGNGTLTVLDSFIHGNEDGILTGGADAASLSGMTVDIRNTEISHNGAPGQRHGFAHNIYAGALSQLSVTDSHLHDALGGHEIKSLALASTITNNLIEDGPTADTSYSIDMPDGGTNIISGNTIEKGPAASNRYVIHFGGDSTYPGSSLAISNNTFIGDRLAGSTALLNESNSGGSNVAASITNNTLYGFGAINLFVDSIAPVDTSSGNTFIAPCFRAGTRIRTAGGEVAVEQLTAGDRVVLADGAVAEISWIGHRRVDCTRHPKGQDVWPVRIRAGAFAPEQPVCDLFLSPDHAVFLDGVLIPVRYLVNGRTIRQEKVAAVTYFHVELPAHGVLLAEGLPCESFLDTGNRGAFANGGPAMQLHPDFSLAVWKTAACAPLVRDGAALKAARSHLLKQAEQLGFVTTREPALHLLVGRDTVWPERANDTYHFRLPVGAASVRLVSRSAVPAETGANSDDARRLGVAVAGVRLNEAPIGLDDARLSSGWHALEPGWRWTDGDAGLALAGIRTLDIELAMTERYWRDGPMTDAIDDANDGRVAHGIL